MQERFQIVGEQSIDYLNIKCKKCGGDITMKYLGWDPGVPHFEVSCKACHIRKELKVQHHLWPGLPPEPAS